MFVIISNSILFLSGLGILFLFLRRLPEAVSFDLQKKTSKPSAIARELQNLKLSEKRGVISAAVKKGSLQAAKKVWNFMLEAKDLKQGQVLASKFVRMMPAAKKTFNIGAYSTIQKAQRL